jgi:hypothetical protein
MVGGDGFEGERVTLDAFFVVVVFAIFGFEEARFEEGEVNVYALQTVISPLDILQSPI